jgi:hypothetical protein
MGNLISRFNKLTFSVTTQPEGIPPTPIRKAEQLPFSITTIQEISLAVKLSRLFHQLAPFKIDLRQASSVGFVHQVMQNSSIGYN